MRVRVERCGLVESVHDVAVVVRDATGRVLLADGGTDRPSFHRSAVKPFQAAVALRSGLRLPLEHVAVAVASHGGWPVHLAVVRAMLTDAGLDENSLGCPPAWPLHPEARDLVVASGERRPRRLYHNCSGKHAAMLRACLVAGWPLDSYLQPDHPLQRAIVDLVAELTGEDPRPVGVDGCGAPTMRGTPAGLALAFARLTSDPGLATVARAMERFPALVGDSRRGDGRLAAWWGGPVKVGAEGTLALARGGVGIAVKVRDGSPRATVPAAIEAARRVGMLSRTQLDALEDVRRPPVLGGGRPAGSLVADP